MSSSQVMSSSGIGRGRVLNKSVKMRKPGQFEVKQLEMGQNKMIRNCSVDKEDLEGRVEDSEQRQPEHIKEIETLLRELSLLGLEDKILYTLVGKIKISCDTGEDVEALVNVIHKFCAENKDSAVIGARLCYHLGDFTAGGQRFRTSLLRKIQHDYEERETVFLQTKKFLQNVHVLCELFFHLRLPNGDFINILTQPIGDYFEMLLRNGTDAEVETFVEQMPKCRKELKSQHPELFERLLMKMRKLIISSTSEFAKASLLELLEQIWMGDTKMSPEVIKYYELYRLKAKIQN